MISFRKEGLGCNEVDWERNLIWVFKVKNWNVKGDVRGIRYLVESICVIGFGVKREKRGIEEVRVVGGYY